MYRYCLPRKIQASRNLQERGVALLLRELTNAFEVEQVFRPSVLDKMIKKQNIALQDLQQMQKIPYRIKSFSLREWEAFDLYSWMQSRYPDHLLLITALKIAFYVSSHGYIVIFAEHEDAFGELEPLIKKYHFYLAKKIPQSFKAQQIPRSKRLSNQQVSRLIDRKQYSLLLEYYELEEQFYSPFCSEEQYKSFLQHKSSSFFLTLWDHWIEDKEEFERLIFEYFFQSYLLKTNPLLMKQKQENEDRLLGFVLWLYSSFESYQISPSPNRSKIFLYEATRQDVIQNFYMAARLGRAHDLYFPEPKILLNGISETYSMQLIIFDKDRHCIANQANKMGLFALDRP